MSASDKKIFHEKSSSLVLVYFTLNLTSNAMITRRVKEEEQSVPKDIYIYIYVHPKMQK